VWTSISDAQRHRRNSLVDGHTGEGKLIFANGEFRGIFNNGKHVDGQFVFSDGLVYVEDDWKYCTSADRRLHSEMRSRRVTTNRVIREETGRTRAAGLNFRSEVPRRLAALRAGPGLVRRRSCLIFAELGPPLTLGAVREAVLDFGRSPS